MIGLSLLLLAVAVCLFLRLLDVQRQRDIAIARADELERVVQAYEEEHAELERDAVGDAFMDPNEGDR